MNKDKKTPSDVKKLLATSWPDAASIVGTTGFAAFLAHLNLAPGVDAVAAALLTSITRPFLSRRYEDFAIDVLEHLAKLQEQIDDFNIESLLDNEQFITVLSEACFIAVRTHQKAKLEALRNAVLNSALLPNLDDDKQLMFVRWIGELTPSHLRILSLAVDPQKWDGKPLPSSARNWPNTDTRQYLFPEYDNDTGLYDQFVRDLTSRGLLSSDPCFTLANVHNPRESRDAGCTGLGRQFFVFVSAPTTDANAN